MEASDVKDAQTLEQYRIQMNARHVAGGNEPEEHSKIASQDSACRAQKEEESVVEPSVPPIALANDMMVFTPKELYENGGLTIMEMICASPCITSTICFSMEVKYGDMINSKVHIHRHRVGARGYATTFLLPWETMLFNYSKLAEELQNPETTQQTTRTTRLMNLKNQKLSDDARHTCGESTLNGLECLSQSS